VSSGIDVFIYLITNKINDKKYVGLTTKGISQRISEHISAGTYIGKALRKYGLQSFDISIIDSANTIDTLREKEKYWVKCYNSKFPNGYNLTDGGDGRLGYRTTEKTKQLMSRNRKGRIPWNKGLTKEVDNRLGGRKLTEEHKNKIRQSLLGHRVKETTIAKIRDTKKRKSQLYRKLGSIDG
jgi:group I intron endonuclease